MTDTQNWTDIIPAIPLARGVPVIDFTSHPPHWVHWPQVGVVMYTRERGEIDYVDGFDRGAGVMWDEPINESHGPFEVPISILRVDLADPVGFAYALRYCRRHDLHHSRFDYVGMQGRADFGKTTDADRIRLAKALAEVVNAR